MANTITPVHLIDSTDKPYYKFLPPTREKCFSEENVTNLYQVYNLLYPQSEIVQIQFFYHENTRILINGVRNISALRVSQNGHQLLLLIGLVF